MEASAKKARAEAPSAAMDRLLPNCSSDTLSLPFHVTWQADINSDNDAHLEPFLAMPLVKRGACARKVLTVQASTLVEVALHPIASLVPFNTLWL